MTIFEMYKGGHLRLAIEKKIIIPAVIDYCEYYLAFEKQRKAGVKYNEAITNVAEAMNTSERTIKRAIILVTK